MIPKGSKSSTSPARIIARLKRDAEKRKRVVREVGTAGKRGGTGANQYSKDDGSKEGNSLSARPNDGGAKSPERIIARLKRDAQTDPQARLDVLEAHPEKDERIAAIAAIVSEVPDFLERAEAAKRKRVVREVGAAGGHGGKREQVDNMHLHSRPPTGTSPERIIGRLKRDAESNQHRSNPDHREPSSSEYAQAKATAGVSDTQALVDSGCTHHTRRSKSWAAPKANRVGSHGKASSGA